jgi:hypothetical protein
MFAKLKDFIVDKWTFLLSLVMCGFLLIYAYGCEPTTKSLTDPTRMVDRAMLQIELNTMLATYEQRIDDLNRQEEIRNILLQQSLLVAQGGTPNPLGILTSLLAILGIGAAADDVRLRRERRKTLTYAPVNP